jgi:hypothetical protein
MHHAHYQCKIWYTTDDGNNGIRVLYLDKDHLHMVGGPATEQEVVASNPTNSSVANPSGNQFSILDTLTDEMMVGISDALDQLSVLSSEFPVLFTWATAVPSIANFPGLIVSAWQNPDNPLDVDGDSVVAPIDALHLINRLNDTTNKMGKLPDNLPLGKITFFDVDGDGFAAPIDALPHQKISPTIFPKRLAQVQAIHRPADWQLQRNFSRNARYVTRRWTRCSTPTASSSRTCWMMRDRQNQLSDQSHHAASGFDESGSCD